MSPPPASSPATLTRTAHPCQVCAARLTCLIGQLPASSQERLTPFHHERAFRKGQTLQTQGVTGEALLSIKLGTVMVTRQSADAQPRAVGLFGRGHTLGLFGAVGHPTQLGAVALSAGRVCEIAVATLHQLQLFDTAFMDALHAVTVRSFASLADWGQVMRLRGLQRQVVAALLLLAAEQGTRAVRLPSQAALASLLSTSRESVARTLRQLEASGHLRRIDRWHCELTPRHTELFGR